MVYSKKPKFVKIYLNINWKSRILNTKYATDFEFENIRLLMYD